MKPGLAALIHPHTVTEFLGIYANGEPFVVHELGETIRPLTELPLLHSLDALLRSWPLSVQAHLPDVRDEASAIDTAPKDAQKLFNNGMGLLFNEANTVSRVLAEWLDVVRKDLGLSALTYGRSLIYATPEGKGTAPHFDQNTNFVLQIHGTKKWVLAPNDHVSNPMSRHTMGLPTDSELAGYVDSPLPDVMPKEASSFILKPGSLLFVPRGYWHSTEAEGDALSLNFTFTAPTWIDLFTAALRSRLALSPEWRETADGVSDPARRELASEKLDDLLSNLVGDIPYWKAADILDVTDPDALPS